MNKYELLKKDFHGWYCLVRFIAICSDNRRKFVNAICQSTMIEMNDKVRVSCSCQLYIDWQTKNVASLVLLSLNSTKSFQKRKSANDMYRPT